MLCYLVTVLTMESGFTVKNDSYWPEEAEALVR